MVTFCCIEWNKLQVIGLDDLGKVRMDPNFPSGKKKVWPDNLRSTPRVIVSPLIEGELVAGLGLSLCSGSQDTVFLSNVSALYPL